MIAAEFGRLSSELFGDGTGVHKVGQGTVYAGQNLADVFNAMNLKPDFDYPKQQNDSDMEFVHRKLTNGDIYFVDNRSDHAAVVDVTSPHGGKAAGVVACRDREDGTSVVQHSWTDVLPCPFTSSLGVRSLSSSSNRHLKLHTPCRS